MRILLVAAAFVLSVSTAHAQLFGSPTAYSASGKPLRLYTATWANPNCSSAGTIEVRVPNRPEHGRISIVRKRVYPGYPVANPRSVCNRRGAPGVEVNYISLRGYTGPDRVSIEVINPNGELKQHTYSIMVR
jgi:hypothetical protein